MNLQIPEGEFRALLFDCDGTIADSMPLHYVAWKRALGEHGCDFPEDIFYAWGGMPAAEIIATLSRQQGIAMPIAHVEHRKEALYYEMLPDLRAVPEVLAEIDRNYTQARLPMAVVSGGTRPARPLRRSGLRRRLHALETRPRALPPRSATPGHRARQLPRLRRHGNGHPGRHRRRHGLDQNPPAMGEEELVTCSGRALVFRWQLIDGIHNHNIVFQFLLHQLKPELLFQSREDVRGTGRSVLVCVVQRIFQSERIVACEPGFIPYW
jgi:hypothetical protein